MNDTTNNLKVDTASSIAFLRVLRPTGPWVLTSIIPDGPTDTQSFEATDEAGAIKFITKQNRAGKISTSPATRADVQR